MQIHLSSLNYYFIDSKSYTTHNKAKQNKKIFKLLSNIYISIAAHVLQFFGTKKAQSTHIFMSFKFHFLLLSVNNYE